MAKLKTQAQLEQERLESVRYLLGNFILPTDRPLLIYARQSTVKQVLTNVYSALQQTEDLIERGLELGWKREQMTLIVENRIAKDGKIRSVSGRMSIEEREGLRTIVDDYIKKGLAGALMCVDVSRLTRGADLVDAILLAKTCKDNHVVIITNDAMFDFNNPTRDDLQAFIDEARGAAAHIEKHIKGKMLKNRAKKASMGLLANGAAPVGLMRDATGNNLIPSLHADRVNWLFQRYHTLNADLAALYHEIADRVIFPDMPGINPKSIHLKRLDGGWTVSSRRGLRYLLSNPAYAGHLVFNGRIVKRDAHPAIVNPRDWAFAFQNLAEVDLNGDPIERPERTVRYNQTGNTNMALLSGVRHDGSVVLQGVGNMQAYYYQPTSTWTNGAYVLKELSTLDYESYGTAIDAVDLDYLFTARLLERLHEVDQCSSNMHTLVEEVDQTEQQPSKLQSDLDDVVSEIARIERALRVASKRMDDETLEQNYATLASMKQRKARLETAIEQEGQLREKMEQAKRDIPTAARKWEKWPLERRRTFVHLATESITLEEVADGWLRLTVVWCPLICSDVDVAYIWRTHSGSHWTEEDKQTIRDLYPTTPRMSILRLFPHRSWGSIRQVAQRLGVPRPIREPRSDLPVNMSLTDVRIAEEFGLSLDATERHTKGPDMRAWWNKSTVSRDESRS